MAATENWSKTKLSSLSLLGNKVLLNSSTDRKGLSRGFGTSGKTHDPSA